MNRQQKILALKEALKGNLQPLYTLAQVDSDESTTPGELIIAALHYLLSIGEVAIPHCVEILRPADDLLLTGAMATVQEKGYEALSDEVLEKIVHLSRFVQGLEKKDELHLLTAHQTSSYASQ